MREMVRKRLITAGVVSDTAFDAPDTLDYLCRMSGRHIRNLLIMVRSACDYIDDLPLTYPVAEQSVNGMRTDFERALNRPEYYQILREVYDTQQLPGRPEAQLLMYNMSILEYLNGDACYAVNPVVQTLRKFITTPSSPTPAPSNTP